MNKIIKSVSKRFKLNDYEAKHLIFTAPKRYKTYPIRKKSGKGFREVSQPTSAVKNLQRFLIEEYLSKLPVHECAYAYRKSRSIKDNAEAHAKGKYLLKMDFSSFFPSINSTDFRLHLTKYLAGEFNNEELNSLIAACFRRKKYDATAYLTIGAPSSPLISNSILYDFDVIMHTHCDALGIKYTRYADDLTFSTNHSNILIDIPQFIQDVLNDIQYPKLKINHRKTLHTSKKRNRKVTGLTISNDGIASIGRDRKRKISAMVHKFSFDELNQSDLKVLKGQLGFIKFIDPVFFQKLNKKYGMELIQRIQKMNFD